MNRKCLLSAKSYLISTPAIRYTTHFGRNSNVFQISNIRRTLGSMNRKYSLSAKSSFISFRVFLSKRTVICSIVNRIKMGRICLKTRYILIPLALLGFCITGSWRKLKLIDFAVFGMMRLWAAVVVSVLLAIQYVRV